MESSTGNEVNRYDDDPSGQVINQQEQSGLNNPWKFAGGYLDSNASLGSNLYKFGTRYYDPSIGRWTQQDPVGGSLGDLNAANRYTYANDDPVNVVDPSGKSCIQDAITTIIALLGSAADGFLASLGLFAVAVGEAALEEWHYLTICDWGSFGMYNRCQRICDISFLLHVMLAKIKMMKRGKGISMKSSYSRRFWLVVLAVVTPALVLLMFSVLTDQSYHTFRSLGNALLILLGILSIGGGLIDVRKARREGYTIHWYQHFSVRFAIVFFIPVLLSVLNLFFFSRR